MKGILEMFYNKPNVIFHTKEYVYEFKNLDEFIYKKQDFNRAAVLLSDKNYRAVISYLQEKPNVILNKIYINSIKEIGFKILEYESQKNPLKTFYSMKYKVGADDLTNDATLDLFENIQNYKQGYTSITRSKLKLDERLLDFTIQNAPSMCPIIYAKRGRDFENVHCKDLTSAYPYLLTQPLPHFVKMVEFENEDTFQDDKFAYYGTITIYDLKAKDKGYFPLTVAMDRGKMITEGENIFHDGSHLVRANMVKLNGFIPDLLYLLKQNYIYNSYEISNKLAKFKLSIDRKLREYVLNVFIPKQEKKRRGEDYSGEKVMLNRIYGFLITKGSKEPAHYGQYIVSKQRLIINNIIHKIGLKDVVQSHTDSIKYIEDHENVFQEYNNSIEFEELGKFADEGTMKKCRYFSLNTAKYIDKNGKLGFKHGGIPERGINHLYKKSYEEITVNTEFNLITSYEYDPNYGVCELGVRSTFKQGVNIDV